MGANYAMACLRIAEHKHKRRIAELEKLKTNNMRYVITPCGKYGTVTAEKNEQCEVKFYNGKSNWYAKHKLIDLAKEQPTKPPSRAHDHLLLTIKTIEGMHKTASEAKTDFAQGAEMAYSLVLDMLNKLK